MASMFLAQMRGWSILLKGVTSAVPDFLWNSATPRTSRGFRYCKAHARPRPTLRGRKNPGSPGIVRFDAQRLRRPRILRQRLRATEPGVRVVDLLDGKHDLWQAKERRLPDAFDLLS